MTRLPLTRPRGRLLLLLPVAFEQLVDERQFVVLFHGVQRREGVALVLYDGHLGPVQVLPVGEASRPRVSGGLRLEPRREHLEELRDQVLFLRRRKHVLMFTARDSRAASGAADTYREPESGHFHRLLVGVSSFGVVHQLRRFKLINCISDIKSL